MAEFSYPGPATRFIHYRSLPFDLVKRGPMLGQAGVFGGLAPQNVLCPLPRAGSDAPTFMTAGSVAEETIISDVYPWDHDDWTWLEQVAMPDLHRRSRAAGRPRAQTDKAEAERAQRWKGSE